MKPAVQCVGGAGKKKPTVEQVGLLEQRNCFPCGNASTDPGCNYQCRCVCVCVCEVGVGMQMRVKRVEEYVRRLASAFMPSSER